LLHPVQNDQLKCSLPKIVRTQFLSKQVTSVTFVDKSKAFDTVWMNALLHKLEKNGINGELLCCWTVTCPHDLRVVLKDSLSQLCGFLWVSTGAIETPPKSKAKSDFIFLLNIIISVLFEFNLSSHFSYQSLKLSIFLPHDLRVVLKDSLSQLCGLTADVPQGSVLDPLLF
jgi:hypothetical protein